MRLFGMSARGWLKLAQWTVFGTLGCVAIAVTFNYLFFTKYAPEVVGLSIVSAVAIPLILAGPLFVYLTMKLRELAIANHRLREFASLDTLTGCLNRGAFTKVVEGYLAVDSMAGRTGALLVVDADHFKSINDGFGHHRGDEALVLIATAIRASLRRGDQTGRLGGEEFGVFLPGADLDEAARIGERVRRMVASLDFSPDGERYELSVSVGGAAFSQPMSFAELFRIADERLYAAKHTGRDRVALTSVAESAIASEPYLTVH